MYDALQSLLGRGDWSMLPLQFIGFILLLGWAFRDYIKKRGK